MSDSDDKLSDIDRKSLALFRRMEKGELSEARLLNELSVLFAEETGVGGSGVDEESVVLAQSLVSQDAGTSAAPHSSVVSLVSDDSDSEHALVTSDRAADDRSEAPRTDLHSEALSDGVEVTSLSATVNSGGVPLIGSDGPHNAVKLMQDLSGGEAVMQTIQRVEQEVRLSWGVNEEFSPESENTGGLVRASPVFSEGNASPERRLSDPAALLTIHALDTVSPTLSHSSGFRSRQTRANTGGDASVITDRVVLVSPSGLVDQLDASKGVRERLFSVDTFKESKAGGGVSGVETQPHAAVTEHEPSSASGQEECEEQPSDADSFKFLKSVTTAPSVGAESTVVDKMTAGVSDADGQLSHGTATVTRAHDNLDEFSTAVMIDEEAGAHSRTLPIVAAGDAERQDSDNREDSSVFDETVSTPETGEYQDVPSVTSTTDAVGSSTGVRPSFYDFFSPSAELTPDAMEQVGRPGGSSRAPDSDTPVGVSQGMMRSAMSVPALPLRRVGDDGPIPQSTFSAGLQAAVRSRAPGPAEDTPQVTGTGFIRSPSGFVRGRKPARRLSNVTTEDKGSGRTANTGGGMRRDVYSPLEPSGHFSELLRRPVAKLATVPTAVGERSFRQLTSWKQRRDAAIAALRQIQDQEDLQSCTFSPQLNAKSQALAKRQRRVQSASSLKGVDRLMVKRGASIRSRLVAARIRADKQATAQAECTHKPKINKMSASYKRMLRARKAGRAAGRDSSGGALVRVTRSAGKPRSPLEPSHREMQECTFRPRVRGVRKGMKRARAYRQRGGANVWDRLASSKERLVRKYASAQPYADHLQQHARSRQQSSAHAEAASQPGSPAHVRASRHSDPDAPVQLDAVPANFKRFLTRLKRNMQQSKLSREELERKYTPSFAPKFCAKSLQIAEKQDTSAAQEQTRLIAGKANDPECTFRPEINPDSKARPARSAEEMSRVDAQVRQARREFLSRELREAEMKGVTFQPELSAGSQRMGVSALQISVDGGSSYMAKMHAHQQETELERKRRQNERVMRELAVCTFKPQVTEAPLFHAIVSQRRLQNNALSEEEQEEQEEEETSIQTAQRSDKPESFDKPRWVWG